MSDTSTRISKKTRNKIQIEKYRLGLANADEVISEALKLLAKKKKIKK